jgi:hypothetical protein
VFTVEQAAVAVIIIRLKQAPRQVVVVVPLLLIQIMAEMAPLAVLLLLVGVVQVVLLFLHSLVIVGSILPLTGLH